MAYHSTYLGRSIWRNTSAGYSLRWLACSDAGQFAADTLAGLRQLVRRTAGRAS
jgi:hypothetical protein